MGKRARRNDRSSDPNLAYGLPEEKGPSPEAKPIEPQSSRPGRTSLLKWLMIAIFLLYVILSYLHAPILTAVGRYLVLSHPPQKSDLMVCLAGGNVERGLAAADAFKRGLAPRIFIAREELPEGFDILRQRGVSYPETVELLEMILERLGVPESAIIKSDLESRSTWEEAEQVRELIKKKNYRSILLVTSPAHSRRAYLTFTRVIGEKECRILVMPSPYSGFRPENWWQKRRFVREVILEYQKLIYLAFKGS